jgi:putative chitinase
MAILKQGSYGAGVAALQQALKGRGFDPGSMDGDFGPGTVTAVKAFQAGAHLQADGVAGSATNTALGLPSPPPPVPGPDVTARVTVAMVSVSGMFPGARVGNITANLPLVLRELSAVALGDKPMVLMALGTIRAETAGFEPIPEGKSPFNTSSDPGGHPFDKYDNRTDLGNRGEPDGANFKGRGFIQLTGRHNYTEYGPRLRPAVDLVKDPEQACDPTIAARLLALFLKDKEARIRDAIQDCDLSEARRLVNGGHNGQDNFDAAFKAGDRLVPAA